MSDLSPEQFVQQTLIDQIGDLVEEKPYIAFATMAIGIEFLGKSIDDSSKDWEEYKHNGYYFKKAIDDIPILNNEYKNIKDLLYNDLRNGFAHLFVPKPSIILSGERELDADHGKEINGKTYLYCKKFYEHFKQACKYVINEGKNFPPGSKWNQPFLSTGTGINQNASFPTNNITSGAVYYANSPTSLIGTRK